MRGAGMDFGVVTLFPEMILEHFEKGVIGRSWRDGRLSIQCENPRDHTEDVHRTVDDRPFGGGPGMVMKAEPLVRSVAALKERMPAASVVMLSPQGERFDQVKARQYLGMGSIILVAGRYEGVDERFVQQCVDCELSIGDFVLSGGEIAAMAVIDAVSRLVPGVLGHPDSAEEDSFGDTGLLDCPHYTRPEDFAGTKVPSVLLSGDHKAIALWRRQQALQRTYTRRKELLDIVNLTDDDTRFLTTIAADKNAQS